MAGPCDLTLVMTPVPAGDRLLSWQASCSCGWTGPPRRHASRAVIDGHHHLNAPTRPTT